MRFVKLSVGILSNTNPKQMLIVLERAIEAGHETLVSK